jgi:hypothetical protein
VGVRFAHGVQCRLNGCHVNYLGETITIVVLIALNGYFAAAEMALIAARRSALQASADRGSTKAKTALHLLDDPNRLFSTISVAITLGSAPPLWRRSRSSVLLATCSARPACRG